MIVLDSSAILANLRREPGGGDVVPFLQTGFVCAVNWAEVISVLNRQGADGGSLPALIGWIEANVVALDRSMAADAGQMAVLTAPFALSLGDRCCLALARRLRLPAITADRAWLDVADAVGVEIRCIR